MNKKLETQKTRDKAFFVSEACHQKVKEIAVKEKQSVKEWVEWAINIAYETYKKTS